MDTAAVGSAPPVDQNGLVTADVPCRGCSYNLRGLSLGGRCPECGFPVGQSIHGNLLRYCEPAWVDRLARGVNLILWGILVWIVATIAGGVLGATVHPWFEDIGLLLGGLVGLAGAWLLTTP